MPDLHGTRVELSHIPALHNSLVFQILGVINLRQLAFTALLFIPEKRLLALGMVAVMGGGAAHTVVLMWRVRCQNILVVWIQSLHTFPKLLPWAFLTKGLLPFVLSIMPRFLP